jgi:hypothetical protein
MSITRSALYSPRTSSMPWSPLVSPYTPLKIGAIEIGIKSRGFGFRGCCTCHRNPNYSSLTRGVMAYRRAITLPSRSR